MGLNINYLHLSQAEYYGNANGMTFELGLYSQPVKNFAIGVYVFNPVNVSFFENRDMKMPVTMKLGLSYLFSDALLLAVETVNAVEGNDAEEGAGDDEREDLVLIDVYTHVLRDELVGADRVGVSADLRVVEKDIGHDEGTGRQDDVAGHGAERAQIRRKGRRLAAGDVVGDGLVNQRKAGRDDHGRDAQLYIEETVQRADERAGDDAAEDESRISKAESLGHDAADDRGKHDVRADREVEHAHDHDKEETDGAGGDHQRSFKITEKVFRRTEIARRDDLEDRPGCDNKKDKDQIALD